MFEDTVSQDNFSPVRHPNTMFPVARGSGAVFSRPEKLSETPPRCFGRGRAFFNAGIDQVHASDSAIGASVGPTACSTPFARSNADHVFTPESLSGFISDLAQKIGESISASLTLTQQPSQMQSKSNVQHSDDSVDTSKLKVIVQHDVTPPPFFRGDRSDSFTVHEWEDMMYSYLNSKKCTDKTASDLILSRLAGNARDVVKVSLRSFPGQTAAVLPATVFDILKRNFSELTYSNMPMADFYNTLPKVDESPMDYWIRLNKAIDVADECLRRRSKCVEDPAAEAVMMFVSHCPDPGLALSFQFKPAEQWSAAEVQERLDCHRRNLKRNSARTQRYSPVVACHQDTVTLRDDPESGSPKQLEPSSGQSPCLNGQFNPNAVPFTPNHSMQQLVGMMDKVLSLCTASLSSSNPGCHITTSDPRPSVSPTCKVCRSKEHTTHTHCMRQRLCRNCFKPGHFKSDCPKTTSFEPRSSAAQLN
ncbi:hypothetical protein Q7C36_014981 [Tachysurus vachellii]|uniref:CCHC-type domain-containing protein n=1 Tax=Tachysurus vachellii TaxID=175792 RepID=A0AA88MDR4_TACVA|nr:hypothetical protein Q7C36_014981 [Tachysurus vachellii]